MNPQLLLIFSPFLAVLYILFALIQALRGKRQGTFAAILAFLAAALSMVAFVVTSDTLARARLENLMLLNAIIAFVASLLILLIERRKKDRDPSRSYGILGIGLSILLALGIYITPLLANAVPSNNTALGNRGDTTLQTISALTPGAPTTDLASVLTAQTGLSTADLTTQLTAGSSIAQLVSAHNGDLPTVTAAVKSSLDAMVASGSRAAQFLTRLGSDTSSIATQIVQGQLPAQSQGRVIQLLTTSGTGSGQGGFQPQGNATPGAGNGGNGGFQPPAIATQPVAPATGGSDTVASVLAAQTGLSAADLTTQLTAGSTIAQLVSAHNGDVSAVSAAIKTALDNLVATGGRSAAMITRLGTDTATIADQIVQGQLPAQQQTFVVSFLLTGTLPTFGGNGGAGNNNGGGNGAFQPQANATQQAAPQAVPTVAAPAATGSTDTVASVLTAQTGLSAADLTTQLTAGSTIAQLVSAHNGDLSAVSAAIKTALDNIVATGGRTAGLITRMGTDTSAIADQIVQGQLPAQQQTLVVSFLLTGTLPTFGGNNGSGNVQPQANATQQAAPQATPNAPADQSASANNSNPPGSGAGAPNTDSASAPVDPPAIEPTNTPVPVTPPPTSSEERPTRIVFPTSTPTPEAAQATAQANAASTSEAAPGSESVSAPSSSGTCTLVTNFNLNLRDKPGKDGIVLLSIPMGTTVTSDTRTSDGWFSVSYGGHDGWVSGQYAGQSDGCASLPTK